MIFRKFSGALIVAAVVLAGAVGLHRAAASQGPRPDGRERWEHCAVVVSGTVVTEGVQRTGLASLCRFKGGEGSCEQVRVPFVSERGGGSWEEIKLFTASAAINRLGNQGWQLVGEGAAETFGVAGGGRALYFKRPAN